MTDFLLIYWWICWSEKSAEQGIFIWLKDILIFNSNWLIIILMFINIICLCWFLFQPEISRKLFNLQNTLSYKKLISPQCRKKFFWSLLFKKTKATEDYKKLCNFQLGKAQIYAQSSKTKFLYWIFEILMVFFLQPKVYLQMAWVCSWFLGILPKF